MSETRRGPVEVDVRVALAPDERLMVLLQLPDAHVLLPPDGARLVAEMLTSAASDLEFFQEDT